MNRGLFLTGLGFLIALLVSVSGRVSAYNITQLSHNAPTSGPCGVFQVNVTIEASGNLTLSNLLLTISASGYPNVANTTIDVEPMTTGQTRSYTWDVNNCTFPFESPPDYTLTACWSSGFANQCDRADANTQFATVPTLEGGFLAAALALLGLWIWRNRQILGAV